MKELLAIVSFSLPLCAQATLHVGAGQPFAELGPAIAAAAPGDRVFVHAGNYAPFALDRGITVRAEPVGALVTIAGPAFGIAAVAAVPAGQHAIVQGLELVGRLDVQRPTGATAAGVVSLLGVAARGGVLATDAPVSLQDCFVRGTEDGVVLRGTARAVATACTIEGGFSGNITFEPVYGLRAEQQAEVHLAGCTVRGGLRGWVHSVIAGGTGVALFGSARGWFVDCSLRAYLDSTYVGAGLTNQSTVPAVLDRTVTTDHRGVSPSIAGPSQSRFLLGVSSSTPLQRGSTYQLDFRARAGLPVIAHVALQLDAPVALPVVEQPVWGFHQHSLQFAFTVADAQGRAAVPFTIPNGPWLQDLPLWFCAWSEVGLPVQLSPVLGGLVR